MNNRSTMLLLLVLAAVAGVLRLWTGHWFGTYEDGMASHKAALRQITQDVDYLRQRRANSVVAESEDMYLTHFQKRAREQGMAPIAAPMKEKSESNFIRRTFSIELQKDPPYFLRQRITAFLFNTELQMPRLRTTRLALRPALAGSGSRSKAPDPGAERDDLWEITNLEFTQLTPQAVTKE